MAYSPEIWRAVQLDYEVHRLSFNKLSKRHNIAKAGIITRAKKESWVKGKTDQIIEDKILIAKKEREVSEETDQLELTELIAVNSIVESQLRFQSLMCVAREEVAQKVALKAKAIKVDADFATQDIVAMSVAVKNLDPKPETQVNLQQNSTEKTSFEFIAV